LIKTKFGQLILKEIIKIVATMSDFKAKMHQMRFRLGLSRRPRWGAYSAPQTHSWISGGLLLTEGTEGEPGEGGRGKVANGKGNLPRPEFRSGYTPLVAV